MSAEWPMITVITPSFNQAEFLEETIQSVLNQRYPNLEYIVVDGGSTDGSVDLIRRYEDRLAWWVSEKDRGQTHAINKGLERATGEIVGVLNSDDVYLPGALQLVGAEFGRGPDVRWLSGPSLKFDAHGAPKDAFYFVPKDRVSWLAMNPIPHPSTFLRRQLFEEHGMFDESFYFGMDYEYWARLVFAGEKCRFVRRALSGYRLHGTSKSVAEQDRSIPDIARVREKYGAMLSPSERRGLARRLALATAMTKMYEARDLLREGDRRAALAQYRRALREWPASAMTRAAWTCGFRIVLNRP
jgi:glycosyltransferase involved in cell wall biosynthesis